MKTTTVIPNGSSQAIPAPDELASEQIDPMRRPLADALKKFAHFGSDFMSEGRGSQEQKEREGL